MALLSVLDALRQARLDLHVYSNLIKLDSLLNLLKIMKLLF